MLKKVSDNIINILIYFGYEIVDEDALFNCVFSDGSSEITGLVEDDETLHLEIDRNWLDNLENAIDELSNSEEENIEYDYNDINDRILKRIGHINVHKIKNEYISLIKKYVKNINNYLPINYKNRINLIKEIEEKISIPISEAIINGSIINDNRLSIANEITDLLYKGNLDYEDLNKKLSE